MKKALTTIIMLAIMVAIFAQGIETFDNFDYVDTGYINGTFVGQNDVTWNYFVATGSVAGTNDNSIDGNGMILRRSEAPSRIVSGTVANGIGNFSCDMRKAYTSAGDRQLALYINDQWVADSQIFGSATGGDSTIHTFVVNGVNIPGNITIEVRNIQGGAVNRQVTIDNIIWTAYGSGQQFTATPTFNPPAGYYVTPQSVTINCTTSGATIHYTTDGSIPSAASTVFTAPISVTTTKTIRAIAYATGFEPSAIAVAVYDFATTVNGLSALRQMPAGETVYYLPNTVILTFKQTLRNQKFVQDAGAAIMIDDQPGVITTNFNIGDGIAGLYGKLLLYFETLEFIPVSNPGPAVSTGNTIPTPVVTIAQLNSDVGVGQYQSRLVRVNQVHFDAPSGVYTTNPAVNYPLSDATGSMTFRTAYYDADYIGSNMHTGNFNLRGIIAHYQSAAQITPRMLTDFNPPVSNEDEVITPAGVQLLGNYPNPFNPKTNIRFSMDKNADASVVIYNQKGQVVKNFNLPMATKGVNDLQWDGKDENGMSVSSGVYYFRLKSGVYSSTKKMVLMK